MEPPDKANPQRKQIRYTVTVSFSCPPELELALNEAAQEEFEGNRSALINKAVINFLRSRRKLPKKLTRVPRAGRLRAQRAAEADDRHGVA